jgi:hypothetical protein
MYRTRIALLTAALALAAPLAAQTRITPGQSVPGTLTTSDTRFEEGAYYDSYVIRGQPGERVVVSLRSDDFDTYLHWGSDAEGDWIDVETDDDGGEGTNSRLSVVLGQEGEFELRAAGFAEDDLGRYVIEVSVMTPSVPGRIRVGETVQGELTEEDYEGENGPEDHYVLRGEAGTVYTAYVESEDFDTYLLVGRWDDGVFSAVDENDDGGEGTNSALVAEIADGENRVVVRSYSGEGSGTYTLRLVAGEEITEYDYMTDSVLVTDTVMWEDPTTVDTVVGYADDPPVWLDEPVAGTLREAGETGDGRWYFDYAFASGEVGDRMVVELSSDEFDPVVSIGLGRAELFHPLETDDDSGPGNSARARFVIPQYGTYIVRVTSARPRQGGAFLLRVRRDDP